MPTLIEAPPKLESGDVLSRDEFLRRWDAMPDTKFAELIGGVVSMSSPVGLEHGERDFAFAGILFCYGASTPGCRGGTNATWLMGVDAPQPDAFLRITEECGGHAFRDGKFLNGAPEFAIEVSDSSAPYDLDPKLNLYEAEGVDEYLVVLPREKTVRFFRREAGRFVELELPTDEIIRSKVFPGLWIAYRALLQYDEVEAMRVIQMGIASPEHVAFVQE